MNQVALLGEIVHLETKRYTPAGLSVLSLRLRNESQQDEANLNRIVNVDIEAVIIGKLADEDLKVGDKFSFTGFLDKRSKKSNQIVFHLTEIKK